MSSPNSNRASPVDVSQNDDSEEQEELFSGSTHSFFIYFSSKRNYTGLVVAFLVIALQIAMFNTCLEYFESNEKRLQLIPVKVRMGDSCKGEQPAGGFSKVQTETINLECLPEIREFRSVVVAGILLSFFLMHDICASLKVMITADSKLGKFAGFIIFALTLYAFYVAVEFAFDAGSIFDSLGNCIGILFITDVDEKAFGAFKALKVDEKMKRLKCCRLCRKSVLAAVLPLCLILGVGVGLMSTRYNVSDEKLINKTFNGKSPQSFWDAADVLPMDASRFAPDRNVVGELSTATEWEDVFNGDPCTAKAPDMINGAPNRCRTNPDYPGYPGEIPDAPSPRPTYTPTLPTEAPQPRSIDDWDPWADPCAGSQAAWCP